MSISVMSPPNFKSTGILRYSIVSEEYFKLIVEIDPNISRYYRKLIPKFHTCNPQKYATHITVVRKEVPINKNKWGLYEGQLVSFEYDPYIWYNETYWWLDCYSSFLENVRNELGLPLYSKYNSPPNLRHCFHTTIGNSK